MSVAALVAEVEGIGVHLKATPEGKLFAVPAGKLTPELRERLSSRKPEVLAILRAREGQCSECGGSLGLHGGLVRLAVAIDEGELVCHDCVTGLTALRRAGVRI